MGDKRLGGNTGRGGEGDRGGWAREALIVLGGAKERWTGGGIAINKRRSVWQDHGGKGKSVDALRRMKSMKAAKRNEKNGKKGGRVFGLWQLPVRFAGRGR